MALGHLDDGLCDLLGIRTAGEQRDYLFVASRPLQFAEQRMAHVAASNSGGPHLSTSTLAAVRLLRIRPDAHGRGTGRRQHDIG